VAVTTSKPLFTVWVLGLPGNNAWMNPIAGVKPLA